jgi:stearoyl-CoA desaturase (Delta-9 desaturase)
MRLASVRGPMAILVLFVAHWALSAFVQSSFHHRYASHRMFTMSPRVERGFHLFTYLMQGPSYLSPRAYAIMHREHHAYSDTARDPHAPGFFSNVFGMMWTTALRYNAHLHGRSAPEPRFLGDYPEWHSLDRWGSTWTARIAWGAGYTLLYLWLATAWWQFLLLPFHWVMGPMHGAIVNWCGHRYGYRNFQTTDASRNFLPFDFLTLGELFQNNHHRASGRLNFGSRWFEVDPTYHVLRLLAWSRLIQLRPGALGAAA